jgi:hypothetical protein
MGPPNKQARRAKYLYEGRAEEKSWRCGKRREIIVMAWMIDWGGRKKGRKGRREGRLT